MYVHTGILLKVKYLSSYFGDRIALAYSKWYTPYMYDSNINRGRIQPLCTECIYTPCIQAYAHSYLYTGCTLKAQSQSKGAA